MNRHDVVRLGRIAAEGRSSNTIQETESLIGLEEVERFAALVEAEERQKIGEDIMDFYRSLVEKGDPARVKVEHCLSLIRLRAKS